MKARSNMNGRMSVGAGARPGVPNRSGSITPRTRMSVGANITPRSMARSKDSEPVTPRSRQSVGGATTPRARGSITPRSRQSVGAVTPRSQQAAREGNVTPRSRRSVGSMQRAGGTGMTPRERLAASLNKTTDSPSRRSVSRAAPSENVRSGNSGSSRRLPPVKTDGSTYSNSTHSSGSSHSHSHSHSHPKRPGSPISSVSSASTGQGSQQSLNMALLPTLSKAPSHSHLRITAQHSRSPLLPATNGPVRSQLRKRRKTIDAVRPNHVQTALDTSRMYTSELLAQRTRDYRERSDSLRRLSDAVMRQSSQSYGAMLPPRLPSEVSYRDMSYRDSFASSARHSQQHDGEYAVPAAKRYTEGLEQGGGGESSGLKVSSVLSFNRSNSRPSITSSSLDSSRSSQFAQRFMRSDTSLRMINPYDQA